LPAALDAVCRARLLAEAGEDAYEFAHNLSREVVWNDLGAARRAALHRRVAETLEHEPGEAQALAYHYARCGEREKAAEYLERAGDRAQAMCANTAAESCYRELVERLDELGHGGAAARAREKLGVVLRTRARYDEALEMLDRAVQGYRTAGDREGQRQAIAQIGRVHARRGTPEEGLARIQALLNAPGTGEPAAASAGLAALYVAQADLYYSTGRYHEQLTAAERAAGLARALHDERLLTQAEQWRSTALLTMGRPEEALPALEEIIPAAEALGDLSSHLHALNQVALAYIQQGEFAKSEAYIARALAAAEQRGDPVQVALMIYNRGLLGISSGRWRQARADFEQAATVMRQVPLAGTAAYPLLGLGHLSLLEGRWEAASRSLQEAITVAERSGDLQALRYALVILAERDLLEGRPEVARARLERLSARRHVDMAEWAGADAQDAQILALLAWTHLELGNTAEAEELAANSTVRARAEQHQLALIAALRVQALLALRRQAWQEAARSLDEALSLSRALPSSYDEARTLYLYGLLDARRGAAPAAHNRLQEALDILNWLGERLYAEHVERALADLPST
jgi:tetratricopeptide (TPR) repeat protein